MEDIGYILFVQILRMSQYPGAPFTGDIIRDIVLFFFIPTVFIILFTYMLLGRLFHPRGQVKLRLLVGIAIYLFIWASGWYGTFAMLAGPYFIFLIVILGLVYFIPAHFGIRYEKPRGKSGGGYYEEEERAIEGLPKGVRNLLGVPMLGPLEREKLEQELKALNKRIAKIEEMTDKPGAKVDAETLNKLYIERDAIEKALYGKRQ